MMNFFVDGLATWLKYGYVNHKLNYLTDIAPTHRVMATEAGEVGRKVGEYIIKNKEIIGLFDTFCMGMINGVFPQQAMINIGMPIESLSQSALLVEMAKVPTELREACLQWYEDNGMTFMFGQDDKTELTREQVMEQCAMMIAMARFVKRFGLTAVGVQYQQGLKIVAQRLTLQKELLVRQHVSHCQMKTVKLSALTRQSLCINEVDMGTAIPQTMLWRLLTSLGLPAETTLHDIRWGVSTKEHSTGIWKFQVRFLLNTSKVA